MKRILMLTPDPEDEAYESRWPQVYDALARPLEAEGLLVEARAWPHLRDLDSYALMMPLTAWGYHRAGSRWLDAVARWERAGAPLRNPASVLRWNADKRYLGALAERGAPVVPTLYCDHASRDTAEGALRRFGSERIVIKPQVSAGAYRTLRWCAGDRLDEGPQGPAMIQPYLSSIETEGEVSLFYFGGAYSHAVRKVPRAGDFRVQVEFQGEITPYTPSEDERLTAETVLAAVEEPLLYARVDLVRDLENRPALIELELIEPDLYLAHANDSGASFARAVAAEAA